MLILKQNAANSVPTPPAGKGTIFLDDSDTLSVKTSDGNVETFPTVAASNSQVVFMNGTALSGEAALTYDFNNNVLTVSGNVAATRVLTDNLLYANGTAWDLSDPGGSNTQIQFNDDESFGGSAAFTFNKSSNAVTMSGNLSAGNVSATLLTGTLTTAAQPNITSTGTLTSLAVTANITAGNVYANSGVIGASVLTGPLSTAAQPNITSVGSLTSLTVTGNTTTGNLSGANLVSANFVTGTLTTAAQPNITSVGTLTGLSVNGNITAANITANTGVFTGNGSGLSAIAGANVTGTVSSATTAGTVTTAAQPNITSVGSLTSLTVTGNASAGNISTGGVLSVTGNANVGNLGTAGLITATGNVSGGNLTTAGVVAATGNVSGGNLTTAGALSVTGNANVGNIGAAAGVFTTVAGTLTTAAQPNITSVGTLTSVAVTGNVTAGNVYANSGTIGASLLTGTLTTAAQPNITSVGTLTGLGVNGTVTAVAFTANTGVFTGNGSGLTNLAGGNVTGQVANALVAGTVYTAAQPNITSVGTLTGLGVNGNITAANITANTGVFTGNGSGLSALAGANVTGQVANALVAGTVYTNAQPNITSVGTLTSVTVSGNVAAGNLTTTGILSVTGTGVSSIAGNLDMTSNTISNLATPTSANDAATKQYVDDLASTALVYHEGVTAATTGTLATATSGTITYNNGSNGVGATLTTTGTFNLIDTANVQTVGTRILVKNEANAAHNGVYTYTSTTVITRATDADSYGPGAGELSLNNYFFVSGGDVNKGSAYVVDSPSGTITFGTSNITFAQFSSSQVYAAGTGLTLTGTTFSVNASQTQVTALGTVTSGTWNSIVGSSATFAAGLSGANLASITGANVTGTVPAATVAGTVTTAAQPNITSVGTLTSLGVNGTVTAVAFTANTGVFTGNGSGLSAIAGGNVTGQVANALVAGTVYTAAQPNITSVGTLTGLGVNGNITAANITANTGVFTGNGSGLSAIAGANVTGTVSSATTAGTVTTAAQPNITSVGSLTGLTLAANADITMSGTGSNINGVALVSATLFEGSGANLTNINASNVSSGTLAQARLANASLTVNGTAITLGSSGTITANTTQTLTLGTYLTGTSFNGGTAVTATVDATTTNTASKVVARDGSGNFSAGTITATLSGAATTAGTVTTAAQPNITSVGTLTSLSVSGQLTNANLTTGGNTTAGSLTGNWTLTAGSRLQATYADLAEKYVSDASYPAGTVLLFGGDYEVTISNATDSHSVAGVVSTNPAYIMNSGCQGEHVVDLALQGRVPVKVQGHVRKGDLMVSGMNGHAVANNLARAGTIIGKALQNFSGDHGVIEIVVGRV